jgi:protein-tyrosine phosphatase
MRVLFVCSGNAHRSPLAEALLKKVRPDLEVDSAGLHVAIPIAEEVKDYLARQNANQFLKKAPESLASKPLREYDLIVAMEQRHKDAIVFKCPECRSKIVVWNIEDPYLLEHEYAQKIYDQIKNRVTKLAESPQGRGHEEKKSNQLK